MQDLSKHTEQSMYKLPEIDILKEKESYKRLFVDNFKKFCSLVDS